MKILGFANDAIIPSQDPFFRQLYYQRINLARDTDIIFCDTFIRRNRGVNLRILHDDVCTCARMLYTCVRTRIWRN